MYASIGIQGVQGGSAVASQYSLYGDQIVPGLVVVCDTAVGGTGCIAQY